MHGNDTNVDTLKYNIMQEPINESDSTNKTTPTFIHELRVVSDKEINETRSSAYNYLEL